MALALIGGQAFAALYDAVTLASRQNSRFKQKLRSLRSTLESLKRRATAVQRIGEYDLQLDHGKDEIEELNTQMVNGTNLVISWMSYIRIWHYFGISFYDDQLAELETSLKRLLDRLSLPDHMHILEMLALLGRNRDRFHKLRRMVEESQRALHVILEITNEAAGTNMESTMSPDGGNGRVLKPGVGVGLGKVFEELFDVVVMIEVKEKRVISKPLLKDIKFLLVSLKPFIKGMKLLDCPHEELEQFRMQMKKGVKLLRKSMKVCRWTSFNKHRFTNKLVRLDESLREQLHMFLLELARKASEVLDSATAIEAMVKQMEKSTLTLQKHLGIQEFEFVGSVDATKETMMD